MDKNIEALKQPLKLANGNTIKNRFAKSAMSENLANRNNQVDERLIKLYETWSNSNIGLIITGNVMVDSKALGEPRNVVVEDDSQIDQLSKWAKTSQRYGSKLWAQINHPGRQAPANIVKEVVAPSAVGLKNAGSMFTTPRALTNDEIKDIIRRFANTSLILKKSGFDGVQIHGAHGYLVSQFLSPLVNQRQDEWGGSPENRMKFLIETYSAMREMTGSDFSIGLKINSADFQRGGFSEEESMQVIEKLNSLGLDLLEVSGGTYEKAAMTGAAQKKSTQEREAYFLDFAVKVKNKVNTPVLLTGGFRSLETMNRVIADKEVDMIGLARPLAVEPDLINDFFSGKKTKSSVKPINTGITAIDTLGFLEVGWYSNQLKRMASGKKPNPEYNAILSSAELGINYALQTLFHKKK